MKNNVPVSVIIPALNEERYIGSCLESIKNLDYPSNLIEIILVDNGSTDKTVDIARSCGCRIEILPGVNISALRNHGARIARSGIIAFLDADCTVEADWVKCALLFFDDPSVAAAGSSYALPEGASWLAKAWGLHKAAGKPDSKSAFIPSGNCFVRKEYFNVIGGFSEYLTVSEDTDLCYRFMNANYIVVNNRSIRALHHGYRKTLGGFFRKELWYGKDVFMLFLYSPHRMRYAKVVAYALFYVACILGLPAGIIFGILRQNYVPLSAILSMMILVPMMLALKKSAEKKKVSQLFLLYLLYGIARAFCILKIYNWLPCRKSDNKKQEGSNL